MNDDYEAQVKLRYFIIGFVRLMGAVLMALGLTIIALGFMDIPKPAGIAFLGFGLFEFLVMPVILSRKWKSPPNP
jgi:uncharacterized membrane protein YesL